MSANIAQLRRNIRARLDARGLSTHAAARLIGRSEAGLRAFMSAGDDDERDIRYGTLLALAAALGMRVSDLIDDTIPEQGEPAIQIIGYVGAGEQVFPADDVVAHHGIDEFLPLRAQRAGLFGVRVRGESMIPVYRPGDVLLAGAVPTLEPSQFCGQDCIVRVANDGPLLVKRVINGIKPGRYHLVSYNESTDPLYDVLLETVSPVEMVVRGH